MKNFLFMLLSFFMLACCLPSDALCPYAKTMQTIKIDSEAEIIEITDADSGDNAQGEKRNFIRWVDFNPGYTILKKLYELEIKYHGSKTEFDFCSVLAYLACKNGNSFNALTDQKNLNAYLKRRTAGDTHAQIIGDNKYYNYYLNCYRAIFAQFFGVYVTDKQPHKPRYGLTAYFPFPAGYYYTHYDDFGSSRSFGYRRKHLGHDMMGAVGTPIVAVEGGTVTELGWNRFGGWRIGILSHDKLRYYYYAHLRKDHPFAATLQKDGTVTAGQVIGYLGNTGYSSKENQNMDGGKPHLHIGMQLIFDDSQKKGNGEIWIDLYSIINLLSHNRARAASAGNGEYITKDCRYSPFLLH